MQDNKKNKIFIYIYILHCCDVFAYNIATFSIEHQDQDVPIN